MFGNQFQPNTNTFTMNQQQQMQQQQQQQQNLMNPDYIRQQNQILHMNNLKEALSKVQILQNQQQLGQLIQILQNQQKSAMEQIKKATDQTDIKQVNQRDLESTNNRLVKIKGKNQELMIKLLTVKGKLQRLLYQNMNEDPYLQNQNAKIMDKIRILKGQITQKCAHLKSLKINKNHPRIDQPKKVQSYLQMGSSLNELKKGAECLDREVLKMKQQMSLVLKYINERK